MSDSPARREAVGETFSLPAMLRARDLTFEAVRRIGAAIRPGMRDETGALVGRSLWHKCSRTCRYRGQVRNPALPDWDG